MHSSLSSSAAAWAIVFLCAAPAAAQPEEPKALGLATCDAAFAGEAPAPSALSSAVRDFVDAVDDARACREAVREGERLFEARLDEARRGSRRGAGYARSADDDVAEVQATLSDLWLRDQAARRAWLELRGGEGPAATWAGARAAAEVQAVDREAADTMAGLLDRVDWVGRTTYGARTSNHAWLLVQHADAHPELQRLALERMAPYLERGDIKAANYAYLFDRVAVNAGRPQRYGTQPTWECVDGRLELEPIEDLAAADRLRAELGMAKVEDDLAQMSAATCR